MCGKIVEIEVLDHVIIRLSDHVSLRDLGKKTFLEGHFIHGPLSFITCNYPSRFYSVLTSANQSLSSLQNSSINLYCSSVSGIFDSKWSR